MEKYSHAINTIYEQRKDIIIGLTGRTGSGCTTISNILQTEKFANLNLMKHNIEHEQDQSHYQTEENLKNNIIFDYLSYEHHWQPFIRISISSIIFSFVMEGGIDKLLNYLKDLIKDSKNNKIKIPGFESLSISLKSALSWFNEINKFKLSTNFSYTDNKEIDFKEYIQFYCKELNEYKKAFKKLLANYKINEVHQSKFEKKKILVYDLYTYLMQKFGNNLRKSFDYADETIYNSPNYALQERVTKLINIIKNYNKINSKFTRICIDSLRNPFEIHYFKNKFKNFYVISINVEEEDRKSRLKLPPEESDNMDRAEYPSQFQSDAELFYHQNIQLCIENADIHLHNEKDQNEAVVTQLVKYIALILHPGLITPTREERCMQIAYNAKLNSGCLSRQVGAVITDDDYSVKAIGWNDVPHNQISCNLRDTSNYCTGKSSKLFSEFELKNELFKKAIKCINSSFEKCKKNAYGLNCHYCFKDIYNSLENNKNQVHTRSLHAEENAFLQITKYGGNAIKGGKLFVTASPCELCSKKSYQLGIEHIYYIDPYPGIAKSNILNSGFKTPQVHLFNGAVGAAYMEIYSPKFALKDELKYISGQNHKKIVSEMDELISNEYKFNEIEYDEIRFEMEFMSRDKIKTKNFIKFIPHIQGIQTINKLYYWTGDTDIAAEITDSSKKCKIASRETKNVVTKFDILFESELSKDEPVSIMLECNVNDKEKIMSPYVSHRVKNLTKHLELILTLPSDCTFIKKGSVQAKTYADLAMQQEISSTTLKFNKSKRQYAFIINKPQLNYSYSIEWTF